MAALASFAMVCCCCPESVQAQSSVWQNMEGGSFHTASNWSDGVPGANNGAIFGGLSVGDAYDVLFSSSANNVIAEIQQVGRVNFLLNGFTYSVPTVRLRNFGNLGIFGGTLNAQDVTVQDDAGLLTVDSGGRLLADTINVHINGIQVRNGGSLTTNTLSLLGVGSGTVGGLTGPGSTIEVSEGLHIGSSSQSILLTSAGTTLRTSGNVTIGTSENHLGHLNVRGIWSHSAGAISVGSSGTGDLRISAGNATLDGNGSTITLGGDSQLLVNETGNLDIGGAGLGNGIRINGTSLLNVSDGTLTVSSTGLGSGIFLGNTAAMRIDAGGQVTTSSFSNTLGTIDIRSGGLAIDGGRFEPGLAVFNVGGTESVAIELRNGATTDLINGLNIGSTATSFRSREFNVLSGSTLSTIGSVNIGQLGDGSVLRVNGSGSNWLHSGLGVTLGVAEGSLIVENGGRATLGGNTLTTGGAGAGGDAKLLVQSGGRLDTGVVELSRIAGSMTNATVTGVGSQFNSTGLFVGGSVGSEGGTAALTVSDVAEVNVAGTLRARNLGTINIDGGHLTTQNFTRSSTGVLNFTDGEFTVLGSYVNGSGNVSVIGAGINDNPTMNLAGSASTSGITNLNVGSSNRQGTLNLKPNAQLTTGVLTIGNLGTVNLDGGRLLVNSIASTGDFNWNEGTVDFTASNTLNGTNLTSMLGSSHSLSEGRTLGSISGTMTLDSFVNVNGGTLSPVNLINNSSLTVNEGQVVTNTLTNNAGRTMLVNGNSNVTGNSAINNNGSIRMNSPSASISGGQLTNNSGGSISGTGQINNTIDNFGTIRATGSEHLVFNGANNRNIANINLAGGTVEFTQSLFNRSGAAITGRGSLITSSAAPGGLGLTNEGLLSFSAGITDVYGDVEQTGDGRIVTSGNAVTTFFDDVVHNGTEIRTFLGSTTVFLGEQTGAGNFTGPGVVEYAGDLRPGNSPASISYEGDVFFNSSVRSFFELGGEGTNEFDQLLIAGDFNLDGDLFVSLIGTHTLGSGDFYLIGEVGGTLTGQFNGLAEGSLVGNFGGRDLFITYAGGNGNDIGLFTAVPEPGTGLLIFGLAGCLVLARRRRSREITKSGKMPDLRCA